MRGRGWDVVVVEDGYIACDPNDTTSVEDDNEAAINTEQLMSNFHAISGATSIDELWKYVLLSSSCLACTEQVLGSTSQKRKAKSLVQQWIAFPFGISTDEKDNFVAKDILIERDSIILANVNIGSQANTTTVVRPFHVIMAYDKYFNKWLGSKPLTKR
eukprot:1929764-Ditylum_brightwellii.AAC.1